MTMPTTTSVLIAGGGPVGLAAAIELGLRGIDCVVLEPRVTVSFLRPRAKTTNVRTMEHFRRWGIADRIRAVAPMPVSHSQRIVAATSLLGEGLTGFEDCFGLATTRTDTFAESSQQIPQPFVEQVLREVVNDLPEVTLALGASLRSLTEHDDEVVVEAVTADGTTRRIRTPYVLGCDGGDSRTRQCLGIPMPGSTDARESFTVVFRAPGLAEHVPHGPAVHYWIFNSKAVGVIGRFDLADTWWAGMVPPSPEAAPARILRDLLGPGLPDEVGCEILSTDTWRARMRQAETFGTDRVFLLGDAAHLNPPWGGHGFNTGVGDAVNIGWKLAATLRGWGGERLPHSYDAERRDIAADVLGIATTNMRAMRDVRVTPAVEAAGPVGERARRALGEQIQRAMYAEFHSLGLVLGYEYTSSPVIVQDEVPVAGPGRDSTVYVPATRPGARLPHRWLADGRSLYDTLGPGLTLLTSGGTCTAPFTEAARRRGLALTVIDLAGTDRDHDDHTALLVRPDQHIAWRGRSMTREGATTILDRVLGGAPIRSGAPTVRDR